jgi:hypothetical protein
MMSFDIHQDGWSRIAPAIDVEVVHGIPVRVSYTGGEQLLDENVLKEKIHDLTGLSISVQDWISTSPSEQEWSICVDRKDFSEVLHRLALASAALFVDRHHKAIDDISVDWDREEFNFDFNHALEHCHIPWDELDKNDYFDDYLADMHRESNRLIKEGISPQVEAE